MPFNFQFEGLLRVGRLLERQSRERLDESMMRIRALEHSLEEAIQWNQQTARTGSAKFMLPAAELQYIESVLHQSRTAIAHCRHQKESEEQRAAELRAAYLLARRERKTVSTLRENALRQFQIEQSRREQSEMDEIFLGKLIHTRHAMANAKSEKNP